MANFFTREANLESKTADLADSKSTKDKKSDYAQLDNRVDRSTRKPRGFALEQEKSGRWVAPIILLITIMISGILWLIKDFSK